MSNNLLWLALWSTLLLLLGSLRGGLLQNHIVKIILLPGLCFDAAVRMVACLVTATPIKGLHPFADGKPFLDTGQKELSYPLQVISVGIRLSLLFGASYWLLMDFPRFLDSAFALPTLHASADKVGASDIGGFTRGVGSMVTTLSLTSVSGFLLVYALLGAVVAAAFDRKEFFASAGVLLLIYGGGHLIEWAGVGFSWFSRGWFIQWLYFPEFYATFSLLVVLSLIAVLVLLSRTPARKLAAAFASSGGKSKGGGKG